jgi:tryptophanyl-tRNA synthetase
MSKDVILTGLRSNAGLTLGNYLGGILPMVELQKKHGGSNYQINMFVPDLHSFTTPIEHGSLYDQTLNNLTHFVAAGLDISKSGTFIYRQSYIPAHSELTWILDCFSYFGELSRMTEFKEKSGRQENVSVGLFNYPVLMAADILLYGAKWVPVGEDQKQHVEFARNIASRFNNKFGKVFVVPEDNKKQTEFAGHKEPLRIRSLRNPDKKMSKSISDPAGTILLTDDPEDAAKKVMAATTDSVGTIGYDWQSQPGITNLLQILSAISGRPLKSIVDDWSGKSSYGDLKLAVAGQVQGFLTDHQAAVTKVDKAQLTDKLEADEKAVSEIANSTLRSVQVAVGLRPLS